mgnify:CR=1 FL=1
MFVKTVDFAFFSFILVLSLTLFFPFFAYFGFLIEISVFKVNSSISYSLTSSSLFLSPSRFYSKADLWTGTTDISYGFMVVFGDIFIKDD